MPLSSLSESKNEVKEGTSRTYIVRGDVGSGTNTSNSLEVSIASLGSSDSVGDITAGDVTWTDGTTSKAWVDQAGASYIRGQALTFGASSEQLIQLLQRLAQLLPQMWLLRILLLRLIQLQSLLLR